MAEHLHPAAPSHRPSTDKPCGHIRHVGTCSTCQRLQLERWSTQLAQARPVRRVVAQH